MATFKQTWHITDDDDREHVIVNEHRGFSRHLTLTIDDCTFTVPTGQRDEIFRLGDDRMMMRVLSNARLVIMRGGEEMPEDGNPT